MPSSNTKKLDASEDFACLRSVSDIQARFSTSSLSLSRVDTKRNLDVAIMSCDAHSHLQLNSRRLIEIVEELDCDTGKGIRSPTDPMVYVHKNLFEGSASTTCPLGIIYRDRPSQYWLLLLDLPSNMPLPDEADMKLAMVSLCHDVSIEQSQRQEVRLNQMVDRIHKLEAVCAFSSNFTHDLNNNLSIIVGYAEMLMGSSSSQNSVYSYSKAILEAGATATDAVEQLLTYRDIARIPAQKIIISEFLNSLRAPFELSLASKASLKLLFPQHPLVFSNCLKELSPLFLDLARRVSASALDGEQIVLCVSLAHAFEDENIELSYLDQGTYIRFSFYREETTENLDTGKNRRIEPDRMLATTLRTIQLLGGKTVFELYDDGRCRFDVYFRHQSKSHTHKTVCGLKSL